MKIVQQIWDKKKLEEVKEVLRCQSYRDLFLLEKGINTDLRISGLLKLYVNNVKESYI